MFSGPEVSVLGIGVADPSPHRPGDGLDFCRVASGRQAHELLKQRRFDLLLLPPSLPDVELWEFIRRTRVEWPWQKWALIDAGLSEHDLRTARMMGALTIFAGPPSVEDLLEIAANLRNDAAAAVRDRPSTETNT